MDQAYIQSFKDGTAGERNIKVDKAYNEVLEARMESILQDATDSDNPWAKIGKLFSGE